MTSASSPSSPSGKPKPAKFAAGGHVPNTGKPSLPGLEYKIIERAFDPGDVMEIKGWRVKHVINTQRHAHGNGYVLTLFLESTE